MVVFVLGVMSEAVDKFVTRRLVVELLVVRRLVVEILVDVILDVLSELDTRLLADTLVFIKLVMVAVGAEKILEIRKLDVVRDCV